MDGPAEHQLGILEQRVLRQRGRGQVLDQLRGVHEDVVVHLHQQLRMRTLLAEPLEGHHVLIGHVAVGVLEVALDEVAMLVVLASQELLPPLTVLAHSAHQEDDPQRGLIYILPVCPGLPDDSPLFHIPHGRMDEYQHPYILITGGLIH